jgi:predicted dithiol-disulfide oxidoreductase (DUF899 family)
MMKSKLDNEIGLPTIVQQAEWQKALDTILVDLTPLGRQEQWEDSPVGRPQTPPYQWWRRHDEYTNDSGGTHS